MKNPAPPKLATMVIHYATARVWAKLDLENNTLDPLANLAALRIPFFVNMIAYEKIVDFV